MKNELVFLCGIGGTWGTGSGSRKYHVGNRIYSSLGISAALTAMPTGGAGGYTPLYLIIKPRGNANGG